MHVDMFGIMWHTAPYVKLFHITYLKEEDPQALHVEFPLVAYTTDRRSFPVFPFFLLAAPTGEYTGGKYRRTVYSFFAGKIRASEYIHGSGRGAH